MLDHGDGASKARFSPDELEVAGILLDFPDTVLHRRVLHWGATRRRSVPAAPVACSPDTPLSFPASWPELSPPAKKPKIPVFSALRPPHRQNLASSLLHSLLYKQSQVTSTCGDSQRVDLLLKSMVRLQSSNTNLPLDLNEPPAETLLHSSEKSVDELESTVHLQSKNGAGLLLDLNALPQEDSLRSSPRKYLRSSPEESGDQLVPEGSRSIIPDLNLPVAEFSGEDRR